MGGKQMLSRLLNVVLFFLSNLTWVIPFVLYCALCLTCLGLIRYGNRNFDAVIAQNRVHSKTGRKILRRKERISLALYKRKKKLKRWSMIFYALALLCFALSRGEYVRGFRAFFVHWTIEGSRANIGTIQRFLGELVSFVPYGVLIRAQRFRTHWKSIIIQLLITALVMELLQFVFAAGEVALDDIVAYMLGGLLGALLMRRVIHNH